MVQDYSQSHSNIEVTSSLSDDDIRHFPTYLNKPVEFITKTDYDNKLNTVRQLPIVPQLLYDVKRTNALTYSQLKIKTCVKADRSTRTKIYDDINVPLFSTPLRVPLQQHILNHAKVIKLISKVPKISNLPLLVAPYSYTMYPKINASQIGIDTNLLLEEYERHYVVPSTIIEAHPQNTMDAYVYNNLYSGRDIDTTLKHQLLVSLETPKYQSGYNGYVDMKYIPEPVILTKKQSNILDWCLTTYPHYKQLVEQYRLTKTPQLWFEYVSELWNVMQVTPAKLQSEIVDTIRSLFSYPSSYTLNDIKRDVATKKQTLEKEKQLAERNTELCYGLSIRKLYLSLDQFREDVAHNDTLYWDKDRDTLSSDISLIRSIDPTLFEKSEEEIVEYMTKHIPFLSQNELKRRAFEIS
jgi:hypothetical protein